MKSIISTRHNLRTLDELALKKTAIHQLPSAIKLMTTVIYLVTVVSFSKYDLEDLVAMLVYPLVTAVLADLPMGFLFRRVLLAAPFALLIAGFNLWFDRSLGIQLGNVMISGGGLSFGNILLKLVLTIIASLVLVATSGIEGICTGLAKLKFPRILVLQLLLVYRYLSVLTAEAARIVQAYSLRSLKGEGIFYIAWGSLLGQFLLRTIDRGERVYQAMCCRGFSGELRIVRQEKYNLSSWTFLVGWILFFGAVRFGHVPYWFGKFLMGVGL